MTDQSTEHRPLVLHTRCVTGFGGGPEKTILNSPRFLRSLGYHSVCAYMHPPQDGSLESLRARAAAAGAELLSIPDRGALDFQVFKRLLRYCREHDVAIWHGHDYKSNALGLAIRRFHAMKLVTTVHGWVRHTRRTPLYYAVDKYCLHHYDRVLCVSEDLYWTCRRLGLSAERCLQVENAIDVDEFQRPTPKQQPEAGRPLVIGAMGRLSEEKGFDLLIRAADRLITEGFSLELRVAGDGHLRGQLQSLIDTLGRRKQLKLMGHVDDPRRFFLGLDAFVLSSLREGLPNVLLEAMALEVPVVSTRVAGVPKLITPGLHGLLVEPGTVEPLVAGLRELMSRADHGQQLASAARRHIEESFSFQRRMEKIASLYNELLARKEQPILAGEGR